MLAAAASVVVIVGALAGSVRWLWNTRLVERWRMRQATETVIDPAGDAHAVEALERQAAIEAKGRQLQELHARGRAVVMRHEGSMAWSVVVHLSDGTALVYYRTFERMKAAMARRESDSRRLHWGDPPAVGTEVVSPR